MNRTHRLGRGLIGYWPFNEHPGPQVFDLVGSGKTGVLSATTIWEAGRILCDASGEKISIPMPDFGPLGTIVFSFNGSATPHTNGYLLTGDTQAFSLIRNSLDTSFLFYINGDSAVLITPDLWDGKEHIITITWNDTTNFRSIWVDGILAEAEENAFVWDGDLGTTLYIGDRSNDGRYAGGSYGWFMAYNRVLTVGEIVLLYKERDSWMFKRGDIELMAKSVAAPPPAGGQFIMINMAAIPFVFIVAFCFVMGRKNV